MPPWHDRVVTHNGSTGDAPYLRAARPDDYDAIAAVVDDWWDRPVRSAIPRLFLDFFHRTSLINEDTDGLAGFLIGLLPPDAMDGAYIHFVGVAPRARKRGLARAMYDEFFRMARREGRHNVAAITSPVNATSIAFHRSLGFAVRGPVPDYNGPDSDMMVFGRPL
jgi:ribosomal protein S18 acetylase RimI-like enzyme